MSLILGIGLRALPLTSKKEEEIIMYLASWKIFSNISLYSKIPKFSFEARNAAFCARLIFHTKCHIPKVES